MASYVNYMRSRTTTSSTNVVKLQRRGSNPRPRSVSTAMNNAVKSKCGLQGCTGCHLVTPSKWDPSKGDGGPPKVRSGLGSSGPGLGFKPLFVDVSVEYELPMVPKIPPESQPLLVIHPGWAAKRRITRSSSQLMADRQYCSQCPPQPQNQLQSQPVSTATPSRKRSCGQLSYNIAAPSQDLSAKRARLSSSTWLQTDQSTSFPCQDRNCVELHRQQMALMQQQQHHQYMLRHHHQQQQQQQQQQQHQWQQQMLNGCPLPLPAPPPPISNRMGPSGGFYGHPLYQWHPAYFCPPSAVQMQRQHQHHQHHQYMLAQQQLQQQQQYMALDSKSKQQQQLMNNNNCVKCSEGKCSIGMMMGPPAQPIRPAPATATAPAAQPLPHNNSSHNTTTVRYRSV